MELRKYFSDKIPKKNNKFPKQKNMKRRLKYF